MCARRLTRKGKGRGNNMVWILIGLAVLTIIGIIGEVNNSWSVWGVVLSSTCGVILVLVLICLPCSIMNEKTHIARYHSVKATIASARANETNDIERAALTTRIIKVNEWLVSVQYWNDTIWDIYIPDEVMELEPLK